MEYSEQFNDNFKEILRKLRNKLFEEILEKNGKIILKKKL